MVSTHPRNVHGMHAAPRCQAPTKAGNSCDNPAVRGKNRCHVHGGKGSKGKNYREEDNGYKAAYLQLEHQVNAEIRRIDKVIRKIERSGEAAAVLEDLIAIRGALHQHSKLKQADLAVS